MILALGFVNSVAGTLRNYGTNHGALSGKEEEEGESRKGALRERAFWEVVPVRHGRFLHGVVNFHVTQLTPESTGRKSRTLLGVFFTSLTSI